MNAEAQWYYLLENGSQGPEPLGRLLELLETGVVSRTTSVWQVGSPDWQPLENALNLVQDGPPPLPGMARPIQTIPELPAEPRRAASGPISDAPQSVYNDANPHPWRRYFARMLDTTVGGAVIWFAVGAVLAAVNQNAAKAFIDYVNLPDSRIVNICLTFFFAAFPNALFIGLTGQSLGKFIFGVKVTRQSGGYIGFKVAFWREMLVWFRGLGLGIPIVSLFTLVHAFKTLKAERNTSWDCQLSALIVQRPTSRLQTCLGIFGVALWLGVMISIVALQT